MPRPLHHRGFTLIEMMVVLAIILMVMAFMLGGTAAMERRNSAISTFTILQAMHESCHRNAIQFGSAGLVYGFSLEYRRSPNPSAEWAYQWWNTARTVKPWVIDAAGNVAYQTSTDLFADSGLAASGMLTMSGDHLRFLDAYRPCSLVRIDGVSMTFPKATTTADILHVAYEPRTGFVHALWQNAVSTAATDTAPPFHPSTISDTAATPNRVDLGIYHLRYIAPSYVARKANVITISATGGFDIHTVAP
jgi:prepilin-type N-terminal cleavage/methylation domain-containing protein